MRMKNPSHPGRLIGTALEDLGVPVTKAAEALGISRQALNNVIAGRSGITPEMAVRLEAGLGSTADAWVEMQRLHDLAEVRARTPAVAAGVRRLTPA